MTASSSASLLESLLESPSASSLASTSAPTSTNFSAAASVPVCAALGDALPRRWIADTHIVLDWWLFQHAPLLGLLDLITSGKFQLVGSQATYTELSQVIVRRCFADTLAASGHSAEQILAIYQQACGTWTSPVTSPWRCGDPDDQKFLDLALAAAPVVLITRDKQLRRHTKSARKQGVRIMTPEQLLDALARLG